MSNNNFCLGHTISRSTAKRVERLVIVHSRKKAGADDYTVEELGRRNASSTVCLIDIEVERPR